MTIPDVPRSLKHPPGRLAGWVGLALVVLSPLAAAAQATTGGSIPEVIPVVNVGFANGFSETGLPVIAIPDTAIIYREQKGMSGTTLIVETFVTSVCKEADGRLTFVGYITVKNDGDWPTQNLKAAVHIESKKKGGRYTDVTGSRVQLVLPGELQPGQTGKYPFKVTIYPVLLANAYRAVAEVTITNHSGYLTIPFGPVTAGDAPAPPYKSCSKVTATTVPTETSLAPSDAPLVVRLSATRLEARLGETLPLVAEVENTSAAPMRQVVARLTLPPGLGYVRGSAVGADSVRDIAGVLEIYLPGPLEVGAVRGFRVTLGLTGGTATGVPIRLLADADDGSAVSDVSTVEVGVVRNRATETRSVIGKVWVDLDRNGRQDAGEPGVADVDVWSDDGRIAATDSTGKFSFAELDLGNHAFRVDPTSVDPEFGVSEQVRAGVSVQVTGWSTPRVLLPLVSRQASVMEVKVVKRTALVDERFCTRVREELGSRLVSGSADCQPVHIASTDVPPGTEPPEAELSLDASADGDVVPYRLPEGWELVGGSSRTPEGPAPVPTRVRDRYGREWLLWKLDNSPARVSFRVRPGGPGNEPRQAVTVRPARTAKDRLEEPRQNLVSGPGIEIVAPTDGQVFGTNRIYVIVQGEPRSHVTLFDGDDVIAEDTLRIDGRGEFTHVKLDPGPHVLRVRLLNSWSKERWDSVAVHASGPPAAFAPENEKLQLDADGKSAGSTRVRVLDRWNVPVVNGAIVTVRSDELTFPAPDVVPSSDGKQLRADSLGWLEIEFASAEDVGHGTIELTTPDARRTLDVTFVAPVRPLMLLGNAQIGFGSAPRSTGAITGRGQIDEKTSLTISYDSRGRDPSNPRFGLETDPMAEGVPPILGDAARQRSVGPSEHHLSAKLERGTDYLTVGDVRTGGFAEDLSLMRYGRALPGATAKLSFGGIEWSGFAAVTTQSLRTKQLRGAGTSGPYILDETVLPGTELVQVELRDAANAQHVISRQRLAPYVDYEIDYERGMILLKQPLPATDVSGNPLFLTIGYEGQGKGDQATVFGLRGRRNLLARESGAGVLDTVALGLTYVNDSQGAPGGLQLIGSDLRVLFGRVGLRGEVVHSQQSDSSDFAVALEGSVGLFRNALKLDGRWARTGDEFRNPADITLVPGTEDMRLGAAARVGATGLKLQHTQQTFGLQDVSRSRTSLGVSQKLMSSVDLEATFADDRMAGGVGSQKSGGTEAKLTWHPFDRLSLWTEARRRLWNEGDLGQSWGDHYGAGGSLRLFRDLSLEARHLRVSGDSIGYTLTDLGLRSSIGAGQTAYGSYQITGGINGASNAAVVGLNNSFTIAKAWKFNTLFERRMGVQRSAASDPIRALPFNQQENDYWSAGLGVELAPEGAAYHASGKTEIKRGTAESSELLILAGDLAVNQSLAILLRQDFSHRKWGGASVGSSTVSDSRRNSTLAGLAYRPATTDAFNALFQLRFVEESNPTGGVLSRFGQERRALASAEVIWSPLHALELGARCAVRQTRGAALDTVAPLESTAGFCGGRFDVSIAPHVLMRGEARYLREGIGGLSRWDFAPGLVYRLTNGFEFGAGYRLGDMRDPDFATASGQGWFATLGLRLTEGTVTSVSEFWRNRLIH